MNFNVVPTLFGTQVVNDSLYFAITPTRDLVNHHYNNEKNG